MLKPFFVLVFALGFWVSKAETLPPSPSHHFNDYASVISRTTAQTLNQKLEQLDRETTTQVVVAVYSKMQSKSSIEDYTFRIAQKWGVGQKIKDDGAVLFVFMQDRQMFLQVGYGLEAVLPDALAKQIIEYEIKPAFQQGNYEKGLIQGVNAILEAVAGTYAIDPKPNQSKSKGTPLIFIFLIFIFLLSRIFRRRRRGFFRGPILWSSGRSGSWGGGGGFSGGGGSFGGGGAGGRW